MANVLCIASAGSGKTHKVITESIAAIERGGKVLVVTYTTSNQQELRARFIQQYGRSSDRFVVKGLYSFYLEDMIRPYQRTVFSKRIEGVYFNSCNPHLNPSNRLALPGRKEMLANNKLNPKHYLTECGTKAHTGFLAKLATRISLKTKHAPATRLSEIYTQVYFDEVQDLVGWDYSVLASLNKKMKSAITCVGDFRQTVYETTFGHKAPETAEQKIAKFKEMGFIEETLTSNRRCIQQICDIADTVHLGAYKATQSGVARVPDGFRSHIGTFVVKQSDVADYIEMFDPTVLRWNVSVGNKFLPEKARCQNFGSSKGLSFDRVLIVPTEKQVKFILGHEKPFPKGTEMTQNKMYVAITRARYSLAFILPDKLVNGLQFPIWENQPVYIEMVVGSVLKCRLPCL
ncbi:MAG: UvrD-helicase domain-containing protein [Oceanospirillales bacterium]|nr:UvrD-helicase domain-containing protein [Oceanospirillales bacterium]